MSSRRRSERGASLVTMVITIVALLTITGVVLDLGVMRNTRRTEQAAVDNAAIAAGYQLSGRGNASVLGDPRAACRASLDSLVRTLADFPSDAEIPCDDLSATSFAPECTDTTPTVSVSATGSAPWVVRIDYPVRAADIADPTLAGGVGTADGLPCERMKVSLERTNPTSFSRIIGVSELTTRSEAVVRGGPGRSAVKSVPALLLLERVTCHAIRNSASGAGSDGLIVREVSAEAGGRIHSDSEASSCIGGAFAIDSNTMSGGDPGVTVDDSSNGTPGQITTYASALGSSRGAGTFPGGVSTAATPGPIVSRRPVDQRFNPTARPSISSLHSAAWSAVHMSASTATAAGYTVLGCNADGLQAGVKIFIDCNNYRPSSATFLEATDVIVTGGVTLNNNRLLNLPVVQRFYVRGGDHTGINIKNGARLTVNTGTEQHPSSATCANRLGPGAGGTTTNTARLVSFGDLTVSGTARLCQTTAYLGGPGSHYIQRSTTAGPPNCTPTLPCPANGLGFGGIIEVGGGEVEWSAPNQLTGPATDAQPFEDLAVWTETSQETGVKSNGTLIGTGVFFLPNSPMVFQSPASTQPRNAQWIARSIQFNQGTLVLKPLPGDAVAVPQAGDWVLIR